MEQKSFMICYPDDEGEDHWSVEFLTLEEAYKENKRLQGTIYSITKTPVKVEEYVEHLKKEKERIEKQLASFDVY